MSGPWNPAVFKDTYRADLMRRIQEKIRKNQIHSLTSANEPADDRPQAQVIDLMEALKSALRADHPTKPIAPSHTHAISDAPERTRLVLAPRA